MAFKTTTKSTLLYVATDRSVRCFCVSDKAETAVTLDNVGCKEGAKHRTIVFLSKLGKCDDRCVAPSGLAIPAENMPEAHFVIGRQDAVYCYTPEGRGQCYAFEGEKVLFKKKIAVALQPCLSDVG